MIFIYQYYYYTSINYVKNIATHSHSYSESYSRAFVVSMSGKEHRFKNANRLTSSSSCPSKRKLFPRIESKAKKS